MKRVVMYQKWHHLLFLHWPVEAGVIRRIIPPTLDVDTYEGRAYVGLVLFTMTGIRPRCLPGVPYFSAFHEFNLRTYVRQGDTAAVWFVSLDAASAPAVRVARKRFLLPYHYAKMSMCREGNSVRYESERQWPQPLPAAVTAEADLGEPNSSAELGTLDHFLIERYRLVTQSRGKMFSLQVEHGPYPLRSVSIAKVKQSLTAAMGIEVSGEPIAHFSDGVSTKIGGLIRL
jgi:uncharacterized protein YqjF (DUF2071 family)